MVLSRYRAASDDGICRQESKQSAILTRAAILARNYASPSMRRVSFWWHWMILLYRDCSEYTSPVRDGMIDLLIMPSREPQYWTAFSKLPNMPNGYYADDRSSVRIAYYWHYQLLRAHSGHGRSSVAIIYAEDFFILSIVPYRALVRWWLEEAI